MGLALITVRDESFWAGGLEEQELLHDIPAPFTEVVCAGYPTGGDNISVSKGVVSRVDCELHLDPWRNRLRIQIDAAINSGNSGGPALVSDGRCVGIAYKTLTKSQNIGYIIPAEVVGKFLCTWGRMEHKGVSPLWVTSFGHGRFKAQKLENSGMRRALGMGDGQSGVLLQRVDPTSPNSRSLMPGDVLLALGGVGIGNDGCVPFDRGITKYDRVPFPFATTRQFIGEDLEARILRDGEEIACNVVLCDPNPLVPTRNSGQCSGLLDYAIFGGLVFRVLSEPYLEDTFGENWSTQTCCGLTEILYSGGRDFPDEQVVVLSSVFAHTINIGYHEVRHCRLKSLTVAGQLVRIRNLRHLVELVETSEDEFLRFEFFPRGFSLVPGVIILERAAVNAAQEDILSSSKIFEAVRISEGPSA